MIFNMNPDSISKAYPNRYEQVLDSFSRETGGNSFIYGEAASTSAMEDEGRLAEGVRNHFCRSGSGRSGAGWVCPVGP